MSFFFCNFVRVFENIIYNTSLRGSNTLLRVRKRSTENKKTLY